MTSIGAETRLNGSMIIRKILMIAIQFSLGYCYAQENDSSLKIGDRAPGIYDVKWIKGEPTSVFEPGKVYVVQFGFIICPPCRAIMPLLTKLSEKYAGKVKVISVYVNEDLARLKRYIERAGVEVGYSVAIDSNIKTMQKTWVYAAGELGYPQVFVIDQSGIVIWIGNGFQDQLGDIVDDVLNKSFDPYKAKLIQRAQREKVSELREYYQRREYETALILVDSLITAYPRNSQLYLDKVDILFRINEDIGFKYVRQIFMNELRGQPSMLVNLSGEILLYSSERFKSNFRRINNPDFDLVIEMNEYILSNSKDDLLYAISIGDLANAYARKGDVRRAISIVERALNLLDNSYSEHDLNKLHKDLALYKNAEQTGSLIK